jgi:iron complex outermembrane receptor protein
VRVLGYYGHRSVQQFLSIPVGPQAAPRSAGGVVDLDRIYGGADVRWSWSGLLTDRPLTWVIGASYDRQNELRRGYNNFSGAVLGVQGALRRDENNIVSNLDEYTQGTWDFAPAWSLMAGLRHSDVRFDSKDHYITPGNGDDSGAASYEATSPVAGLLFKARSWLHLYASYGQGFQTPLGSELAYRADGGAGLNLGLRPARSDNFEAGAKLQISPAFKAEAAVFEALTRNEIIVNTNIGGRSTFQNSGRTRRRGAELAIDYLFAPDWRLEFAYTYIDATYRDAYLTCLAAPCAQPTALIPAGSALPGVPKNNAYAAARWGKDTGWNVGFSAQYVGAVAVNDMNTVMAPGYATFSANGGYSADLRLFRIAWFLRANNLLNRRYVGSIIVGDGNGRYFEPAPGFNAFAGVNVSLK